MLHAGDEILTAACSELASFSSPGVFTRIEAPPFAMRSGASIPPTRKFGLRHRCVDTGRLDLGLLRAAQRPESDAQRLYADAIPVREPRHDGGIDEVKGVC